MKPKSTTVKYGKLILEISDKGFLLWDSIAGQWVIDASCLVEDEEIRIANKTKHGSRKIHAFYPKKIRAAIRKCK